MRLQGPESEVVLQTCLEEPESGPSGDRHMQEPRLCVWHGGPGWEGPWGSMPAAPFRAPEALLRAGSGGWPPSL